MRLFAVAIVLILAAVGVAHHGPGESHHAASDHHDGERFFNPEGRYSTLDLLRWLVEMKTVPWPSWIDDPPQPPPPIRVGAGGLRVTYVNHATVLLQLEGVNLVTDPIWSDRAGPFRWAGSKRVRAPGTALERLPPIAYVLLSHDHYDHLDLPTLERLARRDHPTFIVGLGVGEVLASRGIRDVVELDWWQELHRDALRITFVPARHGSGRGPLSRDRTLWGGFVIDSPSGAVYFAGDTARGGFVEHLTQAFPRIRLAVLPVGSYEKRWFMRGQHLSPDDAVAVHRDLEAAQSVGIHFGTFAEHPEQAIDAHVADLAAALERHRISPSAFWLLGFGEGRDVAPLGAGR